MTGGAASARHWRIGLAVLTVVTLAVLGSIYAVHGVLEATAGAVALALALGIQAARQTIAETLATAWGEHRRHVWFATGLFGLGVVFGLALLAAGVDLLEVVVELLEDEFFPEADTETENAEFDLTASFFIVHNTQPFLISIAGALTLGILTAIVMVFNGLIVGNIGGSMAGAAGIDFVIVGLVPHGIFELPALFIAAGVGFRLFHRFVDRVRGTHDRFLSRDYISRTLVLVAFAWLLLVLAAFVEAYVTPVLLEALFAERLGEMNGTGPL